MISDIVQYAQGLPTSQKLIISIVVVLIAIFILIVLWTTPSSGDSNKAPNSNPPQENPHIVWDSHLGHSYSGAGVELRTSAIQIGAKNNLGHELRLEKAYAVSGEGAGEKELQFAADNGWVAAQDLRPLGNQQTFVLRLQFDSESARTVFDNWKTFQITLVHNGGKTNRTNVTEPMMRALYEAFKPSPIGPQVRTR